MSLFVFEMTGKCFSHRFAEYHTCVFVIISQTVTNRTDIAIARKSPFDQHILKVCVKVMHISTVNISQSMTDGANIAIVKK